MGRLLPAESLNAWFARELAKVRKRLRVFDANVDQKTGLPRLPRDPDKRHRAQYERLRLRNLLRERDLLRVLDFIEDAGEDLEGEERDTFRRVLDLIRELPALWEIERQHSACTPPPRRGIRGRREDPALREAAEHLIGLLDPAADQGGEHQANPWATVEHVAHEHRRTTDALLQAAQKVKERPPGTKIPVRKRRRRRLGRAMGR
jgi:hypothetical protein